MSMYQLNYLALAVRLAEVEGFISSCFCVIFLLFLALCALIGIREYCAKKVTQEPTSRRLSDILYDREK